jgi:hypothetical protein
VGRCVGVWVGGWLGGWLGGWVGVGWLVGWLVGRRVRTYVGKCHRRCHLLAASCWLLAAWSLRVLDGGSWWSVYVGVSAGVIVLVLRMLVQWLWW